MTSCTTKLLLLICSLHATQCTHNLFKSIICNQNRVEYRVHPNLYGYIHEDLYVQYEDTLNLASMSYEVITAPAICNLFSVIWISGEDYYVDAMDRGLYESFERLKKLFQYMYPKRKWNGRIIPRTLTGLTYDKSSDKTALLFSCGLDSTSSLYGHKNENLHLIYSQGMPDTQQEEGYRKMQNYVRTLSESLGHSCSFLSSNYYTMFRWPVVKKLYPDFTRWRLHTLECVSFMGLILPLMVHPNIGQSYFAAGGNWYVPGTRRDADNPFVAGCMTIGGFTLHYDQFDITRFEKVKTIIDAVTKNSLMKPLIKTCCGTRAPNFNWH